MKAIKLTIKNIGMIADATIELNKPLILFYGEIRQGKTTLLNAVKWVFGGSFPSDIIRHGETEAAIQLDLDCGSIRRSFYVGRDGATKSRPLSFERDGTQVRDAVAEIKKFLNPFLLDQAYLANMTELERKKFFVQLFSVNTSEIDSHITAVENSAVLARAKLKAYGEIDTTPVTEPPDVSALQASRARIIQLHQENQQVLHGELAKRRQVYQAEVTRVNGLNAVIRTQNNLIETGERDLTGLLMEIAKLEDRLSVLRGQYNKQDLWLKSQVRQQEVPAPAMPYTEELEKQIAIPPDTSAVDAQITQAMADQVRYQQYQKNKLRQQEREHDEAELMSLDATVRELRSKRIAQLKSISENTGIPGLAFDEAGNFSFEGCEAGMLSTSQIMRLSTLLSGLYPEGFGLDLIDRAESLGRSVFEFVDRAKQENKTIMAAIVGEKPAVIPAEVGVFVVENGRVI